MTSEGHAYARLKRAIATGNPNLVRAAVLEVEHIGLEDALAITLMLLERRSEGYSRAAVRLAGRIGLETTIVLPDAQLLLSSLAALESGDGRAAAEAVGHLCERYRINRGNDVVAAWLARRGLAP